MINGGNLEVGSRPRVHATNYGLLNICGLTLSCNILMFPRHHPRRKVLKEGKMADWEYGIAISICQCPRLFIISKGFLFLLFVYMIFPLRKLGKLPQWDVNTKLAQPISLFPSLSLSLSLIIPWR